MLNQAVKFNLGVLLLTLAVSAWGQDRVARSVDSLHSPFEPAQVLGGSFYEENFETFTVGPLVPQGGWSSDFEANATVVDPGLNGSTRAALHTSDGSSFAGFEMRSPVFGPEFGYIEVRQSLSGTTSLYQIVTVDPNTMTFNTRINFETDGTITVGQLNDAGDALEFLPSSGSWSVDTETVIGIQVTDAGELFVYQDGTEIFAGTEVNFDISGTPGQIGELYSFSDNVGGDTDTQTWDDILFQAEPTGGPGEFTSVPTLGTWGLIALGLTMMLIAGFALRSRVTI